VVVYFSVYEKSLLPKKKASDKIRLRWIGVQIVFIEAIFNRVWGCRVTGAVKTKKEAQGLMAQSPILK
jgi:hypothetical protein